jgi:hypothetical protein
MRVHTHHSCVHSCRPRQGARALAGALARAAAPAAAGVAHAPAAARCGPQRQRPGAAVRHQRSSGRRQRVAARCREPAVQRAQTPAAAAGEVAPAGRSAHHVCVELLAAAHRAVGVVGRLHDCIGCCWRDHTRCAGEQPGVAARARQHAGGRLLRRRGAVEPGQAAAGRRVCALGRRQRRQRGGAAGGLGHVPRLQARLQVCLLACVSGCPCVRAYVFVCSVQCQSAAVPAGAHHSSVCVGATTHARTHVHLTPTHAHQPRPPPPRAPRVTCLSWSPDGTKLAGCSGDTNRLMVWDAALAVGLKLRLGLAPVHLLAWSPDGNYLFAGACCRRPLVAVAGSSDQPAAWRGVSAHACLPCARPHPQHARMLMTQPQTHVCVRSGPCRRLLPV